MNAKLILITVMLMLSRLASAAPAAKLFDVTLEDVRGGGRMLNVGFYDKLPLPEAVDKIVRESLEHAILVDPTIDILATGFLGEDVLDDTQYSGSLVYHSSTKKVLTLDEDRGVVRTTSKTANYVVELEELQTLRGIEPQRKWLSVTIVFSKKPSRDAAYAAIVSEVRKLSDKGLDINAYVSVGNPKVKTSWRQMKDDDDAFIFGDFEASSNKIMRKGKQIK